MKQVRMTTSMASPSTGSRRKGSIQTLDDDVADQLVANGQAEPVADDPVTEAAAALAAAEDVLDRLLTALETGQPIDLAGAIVDEQFQRRLTAVTTAPAPDRGETHQQLPDGEKRDAGKADEKPAAVDTAAVSEAALTARHPDGPVHVGGAYFEVAPDGEKIQGKEAAQKAWQALGA